LALPLDTPLAASRDAVRVLPWPSAGAAWDEPGWLDDVTAWMRAHSDSAGGVQVLRRHSKPWSVVARTQSTDGDLWLKETIAEHAWELDLTAALARLAPDCIPQVHATEGSRMLMADAGPRLEALDSPGGQAWEHIASRYAQLQVELVPVVADLPAPDLRPETLARRFGRVAEALGAAVGDLIPRSLIHLDVDNRNIHVRNGNPVFLDWGSTGIGHPFCGLAKTLNVLVYRLGAVPGGRDVLRVRDAYLEPWTVFAPARELRQIFAVAHALGAICRSAAWERRLAPLPAAVRSAHRRKIPRWRSFSATLSALTGTEEEAGRVLRLAAGDPRELLMADVSRLGKKGWSASFPPRLALASI
jgi:hypothetical protein